jgi:clan AA aspartic protease
MGETKVRLTLLNAVDVGEAEDGLINEADVRQTRIRAVADTGAGTLIINEKTRQKLGLRKMGEGKAKLADGKPAQCYRSSPVTIRWKDRESVCYPIVIPHAKETLLGQIPLEDMDLRVNPVKQCLEGAHGDKPLYMVL